MTALLSNKEKNRESRMNALGVLAKDFSEHFIRSSGHGGQNVNKLATCVYVKHNPSGLTVKYQGERSQSQNRSRAWDLLLDKIQAKKDEDALELKAKKEKLRRQNKKRSQAGKERMLTQKRLKSFKKILRQKPSED